jgi:hypothetical protein
MPSPPPGIEEAVEAVVSRCPTCKRYAVNQVGVSRTDSCFDGHVTAKLEVVATLRGPLARVALDLNRIGGIQEDEEWLYAAKEETTTVTLAETTSVLADRALARLIAAYHTIRQSVEAELGEGRENFLVSVIHGVNHSAAVLDAALKRFERVAETEDTRHAMAHALDAAVFVARTQEPDWTAPSEATWVRERLEEHGEEALPVGSKEQLDALTQECPVCEADDSGGGIDEPPSAVSTCTNCVGGRIAKAEQALAEFRERVEEASREFGRRAEGYAEDTGVPSAYRDAAGFLMEEMEARAPRCTCGHYQADHPKQGPDCQPTREGGSSDE